MVAPAEWSHQSNMPGTYSEALGRPLTEPEVRVKRCLERMPVPDWYRKYSRPPNILKNCVPFECRPASWRTYKKPGNSPRRSTKKRSFRKSPEQSESESSRTSTADSGYQEDRIHGTPNQPRNEDSRTEIDEDLSLLLSASNWSFRSPLNNSNSFPRASRSRRIENINIVFPQPLTETAPSAPPKTVYSKTKNFDLQQRDAGQSESQSPSSNKSHASFLIADLEPSGLTTRMQVFAGPLTSDSGSSDEEQSRRGASSPHSRFLSSAKKSTALERIVQSRRTESGGGLIQKIIDELSRSSGPEAQDLVASMADYARSEEKEEEEEEDQRSIVSSDSELAKSTSISFKSYDLDSADEHPSSPLPALSSAGEYCSSGEEEEEEEEEDRVYWIPCYKNSDMPRTSSQMSNCLSRSGRRSGHSSPGLSPIKREDWLQKHADIWASSCNARETTKASWRQLFRIDETGVGDSGYSDRSATLGSGRSSSGRSSSPAYSSSVSSTPTLQRSSLYESGPYCMRSIFV
ncbi:uncharacterized protein LOC100678316 [Nasonia vitripennis]|uniref:Uncharacterized protein n=1 Tax=Nasonia vitripennis TaxID=7425 RepID=A0A7M7GE65_NASVI|nr:uncharacterized protein LOC100678316 [Nasonia vitripennis]